MSVVTVHGRFLQAAERTPSLVAVEQDGELVTFAELERRSAWVAHGLARRGVRAGDLVGICMARSPALIAALLGIMRAGAAYVPLDATYPRDRLDMVAVDAGLVAVVVDAETRDALELDTTADVAGRRSAGFLADVPALLSDELVGDGDAPIHPDSADDGLRSYVIFTSGSTGRPKGVEVTHRNVVNLLCSLADRPGLERGEGLLALTTISFDIHVLELFLPLAVGGRIILLSGDDARDPAAIIRAFERSAPALVQATPAQWRMLVDSGFRGHPELRIVIGGEALTRPMADALLPLCRELWNAYGPTETTVWSAVGKVAADGPILLSGLVDETSFHVVDPAFDEDEADAVPALLDAPGDVGELWIGGAGVTLGYLGRPDLTEERFLSLPFGPDAGVERVYRTGDLVRRHAPGQLEFLGRTDFQVKIRGFRIELGEVESAFYSSADVRHAVVVAVPDGRGEQKLVAYVELNPCVNGSTAGRLTAHVRTKVPAFMVPSQVVVLERMPLTPNVKIDRRALPAPPANRSSAGVAWVRPQGRSEEAICRVFGEVLGLEEVGAADSFFDLGGTSVMVPETLQRLQDVLGASVGLPTFVKAPTPCGLAATLGVAAEGSDEILARARQDAVVTEADRGELWLQPWDDRGTTVFLTGGRGFVGVHVLERLLETESVDHVVALVRAADEAQAYGRIGAALARYGLDPERWRERVSVVVGDVAAPLFGLSPASFERLAAETDVVIHGASYVNLLYPYDVFRRPNVEGTREIVRLATTGRPKPIHYTSTLDVFLDPGLHPAPAGSLLETEIPSPDGLPRGYEISKWAAETLLINAARAFDLQVSILRIGMVVGQAETGTGHESDEWHRFLLTAMELRALPRIDVSWRSVPADWVGSVIAHLVGGHRPGPGQPEIFHLNPVAGMEMEEVGEALSAFLGTPVALVDPEAWFEAVRANPASPLYPLLDLFAEGDAAEGTNYLQVSSLGGSAYATTRLQDALLGTGLAPVNYDATLLGRSLEFLERKGEVARSAGSADVLAVT